MDQIREIHIAPLGHERDRIAEPIHQHNADDVYLLTATTEPSRLTPYQQALVEELDANGVSVDLHCADLHDLYDVLAVVTTLTADHPEDIVRVNVSSGPKVAAIGSAIACMATAATAYYVHPEEHVPPISAEPLTRGMERAEVLPSYPIEAISRDQVAVLDYLKRTNTNTYTAKKSDLIGFAEDAGLSFIDDADPANEKAKFALLNANIVDPLVEDGYIEVNDVGRTKQVELTETGENVLHAFRHKL
ncbi:hypothetical protein JZX76_02585 [Haloarcula hispanica]|uniref:Uncharacterized protein n=1 Tax=Haloarcula hispanica TaxID=51589 RepID=A0A482T1S4_HALHI|nr:MULTISPECIES: DUF6293 family protein [Haloarcula]AJF26617.1 hypothetical protein SG26_13180 [Haloarcula sp. CBA1115]KAA9407560.1 hypothetical protein Har1131_12335 [Haloarcula sp. CBA1131]MCJ0618449.1 hypothetical protein [Haloarcula hispanica]MUV49676.1 hypothetical protein [Haloarcula sp. CBA1122]RYJ09046.1 hypothetical protein ELS20_02610 [Haloarcula hispanica]